MQEPNFEPFSWFGPPIFGVKKTSKCEFTQKHEKTQWIDQKCMSFDTTSLKKCASYLRKMTHRKNAYFSKFRAPSFLHCVFYHLRYGRQKKKKRQGPAFKVFRTSWPILRLSCPEIFGTGMCDRTAGFYHVLSVFVVLSMSVESATECQMTCLMKCFVRCVFERYDAVCHVGASRRNRLWRPRKPSACGPKHCRFSRTTSRLACPRPVIHAGQKCPKNTAVESRLCRVTLCCSAHKQAWKRATARCLGSVKTYAQGP